MLLSGSLRLLSLAERQGAFSSCQGAAIGGQGAFRGGQGAPVSSARNLASATQIPKKPRSPWVDYFVSNYPAVKKTHPDLKTAPQVMKKMSADWKLLPSSQKASLTFSYKASMARWQQEMAMVPVETQEAALQEKRGIKAAKLGRTAVAELSSLLASLGKPVQPPSSFFLFLGERRPALRGSPTDNVRQMTQEWGRMGLAEKEVFSKKALAMKADYEKEKVKWTKRMEKQGKMPAIQEAEERVAAHKRVARGSKGEAELRSLLSSLGQPSRPATPYQLYCTDRRKAGSTGKELKWKELSEAKKEVYSNKYAQLKGVYDSDMKKWTLKMEKGGKMPSIQEAEETVAALKRENKNKES